MTVLLCIYLVETASILDAVLNVDHMAALHILQGQHRIDTHPDSPLFHNEIAE